MPAQPAAPASQAAGGSFLAALDRAIAAEPPSSQAADPSDQANPQVQQQKGPADPAPCASAPDDRSPSKAETTPSSPPQSRSADAEKSTENDRTGKAEKEKPARKTPHAAKGEKARTGTPERPAAEDKSKEAALARTEAPPAPQKPAEPPGRAVRARAQAPQGRPPETAPKGGQPPPKQGTPMPPAREPAAAADASRLAHDRFPGLKSAVGERPPRPPAVASESTPAAVPHGQSPKTNTPQRAPAPEAAGQNQRGGSAEVSVQKAGAGEREAARQDTGQYARREPFAFGPPQTPRPATASPGQAAAQHAPRPQEIGIDAVRAWRRYDAEAGASFQQSVRTLTAHTSAEVRAQVIRHVQFMNQNGRATMRLQLNPPEMGRIRLEFEMRSGTLEVRMRVENPDVREAMTRELTNLDRALRDAQVEVQRFEVTDYQSGRRSPEHETGQGHLAGAAGGQTEGLGHEDAAALGWARISQSGDVDCLI